MDAHQLVPRDDGGHVAATGGPGDSIRQGALVVHEVEQPHALKGVAAAKDDGKRGQTFTDMDVSLPRFKCCYPCRRDNVCSCPSPAVRKEYDPPQR